MNEAPRARRSNLAVPGSSPKMMAKAAALPTDQLFFDLEDAVAPHNKASARSMVVDALNSHDYGTTICAVRINDVTTPFAYRDILEIVGGAGDQLDCLMVPKVSSAADIHFVDRLVTSLEAECPRSRPLGLEVLIESPQGATAVAEIAKASPRIQTLIFGVGDYQISMGISRFDLGRPAPSFPTQWHWVMSGLANHALAASIQPIDGPYVVLGDRDGYMETARRGKLLGFVGKWCIHPEQIEWANEAYRPTQEELDTANAVLDRYAAATAEGLGATRFDGLMIDEATRKLAQRIVDAAGDGAAPREESLR
jgi:citrate lyase subunit beta/citryl-CoA lyase